MSSIDNAIADIKRQLRSESKSDLIRQWVALYAQVTQLLVENERLKKELEALQPKPSEESPGFDESIKIEQASSEGSET